MKILALLSLLFFIIFTSEPFSGTCEPLVDSSGDEVRVGNTYYIIPGILRIGVGLGLSPGRSGICPLDVVQVGMPGFPLTFSPAHDKDGIVYESADLNIKFNDSVLNPCEQSLTWKVDDYDESAGKWFITTGGGSTPQSLFKFQKFNFPGIYKIVHCRSGSGSACSDVGVYGWGGATRLALSDVPFYYRFIKAEKYGKGNNNVSVM